MLQIVLVGCFGAIGAICRYSVSAWVDRMTGGSFPWGTLGVNVVGCLLIGSIAVAGTEYIPPAYRSGVQVGLLGAFTTFSTFGYETLMQLQAGQWRGGLANIGANVLLGLVAVWAGMIVGRALIHAV